MEWERTRGREILPIFTAEGGANLRVRPEWVHPPPLQRDGDWVCAKHPLGCASPRLSRDEGRARGIPAALVIRTLRMKEGKRQRMAPRFYLGHWVVPFAELRNSCP